MSYDQMKMFYFAARQCSFTLAARELKVSQPTVTSQIKQLEESFGAELFHRRGRRLRVTEIGQQLMPLVEKMMLQEAEIEKLLRNTGDLQQGHLKIGATGPYYIMGALQRFTESHPSINVTCEINNSENILRALYEYRIDVAVSSHLGDDARLVTKRIASEPLVLLMHRSHPYAHRHEIAPAMLANVQLLSRERGSMTRQVMDKILAQANVVPERLIELGSREAIREAILHNVGCSLLPRSEISAHPDLRAIALTNVSSHMEEYLYCLKDLEHHPLISKFLSLF